MVEGNGDVEAEGNSWCKKTGEWSVRLFFVNDAGCCDDEIVVTGG